MIGALVAGVSLLLVPHTFITHSSLRITYLFLAPIASGYTAFALSQKARSKNKNWSDPKRHALCALLFALTLTAIRFTYAQR